MSPIAQIREATKYPHYHKLLAWPWAIGALIVFAVASTLAWFQPSSRIQFGPDGMQTSFWSSFVSPHEGYAYQRLPSLPSKHFSAIHFLPDAKQGWIVGEDGVIVHTADGGATWTVQPSPVGNYLRAVFFLPDGRQGWAAGDGGIILHTSNGGLSWELITPSTPLTANITHIAFLSDGQMGVIQHRSGRQLLTMDGGKTWSDESQEGTLDDGLFSSMTLGGGAAGIVTAAQSGFVELYRHDRKTGAGQKLEFRGTPVASRISADATKAQVLTSSGEVAATSDGGREWNVVSPATEMPELETGYLTTQGMWGLTRTGDVYASEDGGRNWQLQAKLLSPRLRAIWMQENGSGGWIVGNDGAVMGTRDGGRTWFLQSSNAGHQIAKVYFNADGQRGWRVHYDGTVLGTTDGGETWKANGPGLPRSFIPIALGFDETNTRGIVVDRTGDISVTTDGGRSWSRHVKSLGTVSSARVLGGRTVFYELPLGPVNRVEIDDPQQEAKSVTVAQSRQVWTVIPGGQVVSAEREAPAWGSGKAHGDRLRATVIAATPDQGYLLVATSAGAIFRSVDRGGKWEISYRSDALPLRSIVMSGDGQRIWAVGKNGIILNSTDGGAEWGRQYTAEGVDLVDIGFSANPMHGWALSRGGSLLLTSDGGRHWTTGEKYSWVPAPWFGAAILTSLGLLVAAYLRRPVSSAQATIAGQAWTDQEVTHAAQDKLNFGGLARGISRFLRNAETRPPLTIATSGPWGSGKSSLLRMVCGDLRRHGHRPIWFNAWHHQKEEHLFAALLGEIRAQAVPPFSTLTGVLFRFQLMYMRSRKHYVITMLAVAGATALVAIIFPILMQGGIAGLSGWLNDINGWLKPAAASAGGLGVIAAFIKAVKPFSVNPSVLLAGISDSMSLRTAAAQNDFRTIFSRQFGELTAALPYRLFIIIDDLDRCKPAAVAEVMESVNYLTAAGKCCVLFGMDRDRVVASLGLAFKDVALELQKQQGIKADDDGASARRQYAEDYLHKLINIEIVVPSLTPKDLPGLVTQDAVARPGWFSGLAAFCRKYGVVLPLCAAIGIGITLADHAPEWRANFTAKPVAKTTVLPPVAAVGARIGPPPPERVMAQGALAPMPMTPARVGSAPGNAILAAWITLPALALGALSMTLLFKRLLELVTETKDSEQFRSALRIWAPVVVQRQRTPRHLKRFCNRLRYLAMLQQGRRSETTYIEELRRRVLSMDTEQSGLEYLPEEQLVALGALYEYSKHDWKSLCQQEASDQVLATAIKNHQEQFGNWPPSTANFQTFEQMLIGTPIIVDVPTPQPASMAGTERVVSGRPEQERTSSVAA